MTEKIRSSTDSCLHVCTKFLTLRCEFCDSLKVTTMKLILRKAPASSVCSWHMILMFCFLMQWHSDICKCPDTFGDHCMSCRACGVVWGRDKRQEVYSSPTGSSCRQPVRQGLSSSHMLSLSISAAREVGSFFFISWNHIDMTEFACDERDPDVIPPQKRTCAQEFHF